MRIVESIGEMQAEAERARRGGRVGLVPTMGAFHEGHLSLMRRARAESDLVIVSLYVNPRQFGPGEDFTRYPRHFEQDCAMARAENVDILFAPAAPMYASDHATYINTERLDARLCGASRPSHFRGVATVVAKLFNIAKPHRAYFGLKDFQQVRVIETMIRDLNFDLELVRCAIVREPDGLAMSSRNAYLAPEERRAATVLYRSLCRARESILAGQREAQSIVAELTRSIESEPLANIDYVAAVSTETLEPLDWIEGSALLALAVRFGRARLIDNLLIDSH